MVAVHIAVPQSAAGVVDNRDWDARQTHATSETHHCRAGSSGWVVVEVRRHNIDTGVLDWSESGCWRGCSAT